MSLFIAIAAVLAVLAVVLVALPLVRPRPDEQGKPVGASQAAAITVVVAVPVVAFILYFTLSDWPWDEQAQLQQAAGTHSGGGSLSQVADQLEQRLARGQGDLEGWMMLGRTYVVMGDYPKALKAYTQAYTLTSGQNVEAMLGYAEARVLVDESEFEGEAGQLFERAVAMAPDNGKALWYGGVTAYRKQDLPLGSCAGALRIGGILVSTWWAPGLRSTLLAGGPWLALLALGYRLSSAR